jgi:hypothetical protein
VSVGERLAAASNRCYLRIRHPQAFEAAARQGTAAEATARVLRPGESDVAERAIAANYGAFRRVYEGAGSRLGIDTLYIEVTPGRSAE